MVRIGMRGALVPVGTVIASLLLPSAVLAQQNAPGNVPWVFPFPNPFQPPPAAPTAPANGPTPPLAPTPPVVPSVGSAGAPVVLELFTSMDCAACESAEYAVNRVTSQGVAGARVIPLAYHVEFYGGTSGTDPYILPAGTHRQSTYDAARGRVYTPQAIVDGDREFVGSEDSTARTAIATASRQPKVAIDVSRALRFVGPQAPALSIRYGNAGGRRGSLTVVLTESGLVEKHHGGLTDYDRTPLVPVVRSIQAVGAASPGGGVAEATVAIPAGTVRANLTAVVLLEDTGSHHILGAATLAAGAF